MKKLNVYTWRGERKQIKLKRLKKEEEEFLIYTKIRFILEKTNRKWCDFKSYCTSFRKRRRRYWNLMFRKKYVWYGNLKKTN